MADRQGRLKAIIGKDIADIVSREIKNPHVGMVSVNEVVVNSDCSEAKVYVTFFESGHEASRLKELKKSEGFVRTSLAKKLDVYKVPKVSFHLDETFKKAASLEDALSREQRQLDDLADKR